MCPNLEYPGIDGGEGRVFPVNGGGLAFFRVGDIMAGGGSLFTF